MRRSLLAAPLLLCACASREAPPPSGALDLLAEARATLRALRGQRLDRVQLALHTVEELRAATLEFLDASLPQERSRGLSRLLSAVGLLKAGRDLRAEILRLATRRTTASYDPKKEVVFVPDGVGRSALLHELTHALQDQRFDLKALSEPFERSEFDRQDESFAFECLREGEATYLELASEARGDLRELRRRLIVAPPPPRPDAPSDPLELLWSAPYRVGPAFVAWVVERHGWEGIDRLWSDLPLSSEQILHPEKALGTARDAPQRLLVPDLSAEAGGPLIASETLGEIGWRLVFEAMSGGREESACAGWDGDRVQAYALARGLGLVWASTWDSLGDAREFEVAVERCVAATRGPLSGAAVFRQGRDVLVLSGFPERRREDVRKAAWLGLRRG